MISRPFLSPGSKGGIAEQLIRLFRTHDTYVEPFAGAAAVFWRKPMVKREVLADLEPDIPATLKFLRDMDDDQIDMFLNMDWEVSEDHFLDLQEMDDSDLTPFERAYRFIYLRRASMRHDGRYVSRNSIEKRLPINPDRIAAWQERLFGVELRCADGIDTITDMDDPGTLIFVDPPWPGFSDIRVWRDWTEKSFAKMFDALNNLQYATWVYAEHPDIGKMFDVTGYYQTTIKKRPSRGMFGTGELRQNTELVLSNHPFRS